MAKIINVELIAPFIRATHKTLETMTATKVERKNVFVKRGYVMTGDISSMIGMSGPLTGTCSLSLTEGLAVRLVETLTSEKIENGVNDSMVHDGVGEFINIIAGDAKLALSKTRYKFNITLPTIITGQGFEIYHRTGTRCVEVEFVTEQGEPFAVDVTVPVEDAQ